MALRPKLCYINNILYLIVCDLALLSSKSCDLAQIYQTNDLIWDKALMNLYF